MTTKDERDGVLAAVERIVNRGEEDVVGETVAVLRRVYPSVALRDGVFLLDGASEDDRRLLDRVEVLLSHFTR